MQRRLLFALLVAPLTFCVAAEPPEAVDPPAAGAAAEARETAPVLPVDDAVVDATLPHMPAVVADMVRLQRCTGMRPAEVCMIRPCDLDRTGDLKFTVDFRSVYAAILNDYLGADATKILAGSYTPVGVIKTAA